MSSKAKTNVPKTEEPLNEVVVSEICRCTEPCRHFVWVNGVSVGDLDSVAIVSLLKRNNLAVPEHFSAHDYDSDEQ